MLYKVNPFFHLLHMFPHFSVTTNYHLGTEAFYDLVILNSTAKFDDLSVSSIYIHSDDCIDYFVHHNHHHRHSSSPLILFLFLPFHSSIPIRSLCLIDHLCVEWMRLFTLRNPSPFHAAPGSTKCRWIDNFLIYSFIPSFPLYELISLSECHSNL